MANHLLQEHDAYVSEQSLSMFEAMGVMSHREAEARHEILLESYFMKIQIESRVLGDLAGNHIVPTAIKYQNTVDNIQRLKEIMVKTFNGVAKEQLEMIKEISARISKILSSEDAMIEAHKAANALDNVREKAIAYYDNVKPFFEVIRYEGDEAKLMIDDEQWPIPKFKKCCLLDKSDFFRIIQIETPHSEVFFFVFNYIGDANTRESFQMQKRILRTWTLLLFVFL